MFWLIYSITIGTKLLFIYSFIHLIGLCSDGIYIKPLLFLAGSGVAALPDRSRYDASIVVD